MRIGGQILRFGMVGGLATLVHMGVAALLVSVAMPWPLWVINFVAFAVAFWVSFFGHRYFTFQAAGSPVRFLGAALAGFAANNVVLALVWWLTRHDLVSVILAAAAAPVVVFVVSRLWVFR